MLIVSVTVSVGMGVESDPAKPRVPASEIEKARAAKPPVNLNSADVIAKGKAIFLGKGACFTCHGQGGKGNGMDPSSPDFTNPRFAKLRTPGEMMWILKNGSPNTSMVAVIPARINEEEGWQVIAYERSLGGH
ncbi:MAG: c-type cytochrome [Nitrospiria bacterium]